MMPLPLTTMEQYYWTDDSDDYPTTFPVLLRFGGVLREGPLREALAVALQRHPIFSWRVDSSGRRPCWVAASTPTGPYFDWGDARSAPSHPRGERIDLASEGGLRLWVRAGADGSELLIQFHHACCDGIGALQFVEDLLIAYAGQTLPAGHRLELRRVDPSELRYRGAFGRPDRVGPSSWRVKIQVAKEWAKLLWHEPAVVAAADSPVATADTLPFLGFRWHRFSRETTRALRNTAALHKVMLNDLLLAHLFIAIRNWNRQHQANDNDRLRINMPTNMRTKEDRFLPASSTLSFTFLTRAGSDCDRPDELLASVHEETSAIKHWQLGFVFVGGLEFAAGLPGLTSWVLGRPRCFATAVFSNMGRVLNGLPLPRENHRLVCGDVVLEELLGVPPIRPLTRAALVALTYAGQLTLCARCDPRFFSGASTQRFLDHVVSQILAQAES
jgi:hypothetical protein